MNTLTDQIKHLLATTGLKPNKIAEMLGTTPHYVRAIRSRLKDPVASSQKASERAKVRYHTDPEFKAKRNATSVAWQRRQRAKAKASPAGE